MVHKRCIGTCTDCGKEKMDLMILDDVDRLCEQCLDASYIRCDICGEYYSDTIDFTYTDDQTICEYCMEDLDDEDDPTEDEE